MNGSWLHCLAVWPNAITSPCSWSEARPFPTLMKYLGFTQLPFFLAAVIGLKKTCTYSFAVVWEAWPLHKHLVPKNKTESHQIMMTVTAPSVCLPSLLTLIILLPLVLLLLGPSFFMFAFQYGNFHPPTFICSYHTGNYCCDPSKRIQTQQNFSVKNNCLFETCAFIRHKLFCSV